MPIILGRINKMHCGPSQLGHKARPYFKTKQSKKNWEYESTGRVLASKCKALSSNSSTAEKIEWTSYRSGENICISYILYRTCIQHMKRVLKIQ
jgi:hypothetical protein